MFMVENNRIIPKDVRKETVPCPLPAPPTPLSGLAPTLSLPVSSGNCLYSSKYHMTWVVSFKHSALTGSHDKDEITFLLPLPLHLFNIIILLFLVEFVIHIFMYNITTTKYFLLLLQNKVLFCYSIFFSGVVTFHPPLPLKFLVPPFLPFSLPFFFPSFLLSNVVFFFSFFF